MAPERSKALAAATLATDRAAAQTTHRPAGRMLPLAVGATALMLTWLGWHVYHSFRVARAVEAAYVQTETLHDLFCDLQQQSLVAVALAVSGGGEEWRRRHAALVQRLDDVIANALLAPVPGYDIEALQALATAHHALRALEAKALGHPGEDAGGVQILASDAYRTLAQGGRTAAQRLIEAYRDDVGRRLRREGREELGSLAVAFAIFTISLATWLSLLGRLQRWRVALRREMDQRLRAERGLNAALVRYRGLFDNANDAILLLDPAQLRVIDANAQASVQLGFPRDGLLGLPMSAIDKKFRPAPDDRPPRCVRERLWRRADGSLLPFEVSERLIDVGNARAYQLCARDVSACRRLEQELTQSQKMEVVGQLASGVAHDFNNLITAINGYVFLAKAALPTGRSAVGPLDKLEEAASQAAAVTRSLLTFSRRSETERETVELAAVVQGVAGLLQGMLPATIGLELDMARADLWVLGDRRQLQQALLNIAINDRDAMPDGGTIRIAVDGPITAPVAPGEPGEERPMVRVRITDTGQGMDEAVRRKAFDPFFTTKPRGRGTGLGLAVVLAIVNAHGGRVTLSSVPEVGTTVSILLPQIAGDGGSATTANAAAGRAARPATILLAEDHGYVREIIATALRMAGYEVIETPDGPTLLARFHDRGAEVDLLVLDLDLPGRSGLECLQTIRAHAAKVPAIVITGTVAPDLEDRLEGEALLLRKPFEMGELTRLATGLLGGGHP